MVIFRDNRKDSEEEIKNDFVEVPRDIKKYVLGRSRCEIDEIEKKSRASIRSQSIKEEGFWISGNKIQRECAKKLITEKVVGCVKKCFVTLFLKKKNKQASKQTNKDHARRLGDSEDIKQNNILSIKSEALLQVWPSYNSTLTAYTVLDKNVEKNQLTLPCLVSR